MVPQNVFHCFTLAYRILKLYPEFEKFAHPWSALLIAWPVWNPERNGMCPLQDKEKPTSLICQIEWVAGLYGNNFIRHCHARKLNGDRLLLGETGQSCCWVLHYTQARTEAVRPDSSTLPILILEPEICLKIHCNNTWSNDRSGERAETCGPALGGKSSDDRIG